MSKNIKIVYEQPYRLENDGLSQTSTRQIYYPDDLHGPTKIQINTHLPPFVLPSYWRENNLNEKDVSKILEYISPQLLWVSCLVHGADVLAACLKPSFQKNDEVCISYKKEAIRTLIAHLQFKFTSKTSALNENGCCSSSSFNKKSISSSSSDDNNVESIFPLPKKEIPSKFMPLIPKLFPKELKALHLCSVQGLLTIQNKRYLPIKLEGNFIHLQRATEYQNYERSKKKHKYGLASLPFVVQTPDGVNHALCEDGILVSSQPQQQQQQQQQ